MVLLRASTSRKTKPQLSKYGVDMSKSGKADRTYNGTLYHSKLECRYARYLDILLERGEIAHWSRQPRLPLHGPNGSVLGEYRPDFKITADAEHETASTYFVDTKGVETELFKWKLKHLLDEYPGVDLRVVKRKDMPSWV